MPPRSSLSSARVSLRLPRTHSVSRPTICVPSFENVRLPVLDRRVVLDADLRFRAQCLDHRHLHAVADAENGISRSRANRTAWILPSTPRSPKPPGTRMACTSESIATASSSVWKTDAFTHSIFTRTLFAMPPWVPSPRSAICRRPSAPCICRRRRSSPRRPAWRDALKPPPATREGRAPAHR